MLLFILMLLLTIASAAVVTSLLILERPRAASARDGVARHIQLSSRRGCRRTPMLEGAG